MITPIGLIPSRIGDTSDQAVRATTTATTLPAIEAQESATWKGLPSASSAFPGGDDADGLADRGERRDAEVGEEAGEPVEIGPFRDADAVEAIGNDPTEGYHDRGQGHDVGAPGVDEAEADVGAASLLREHRDPKGCEADEAGDDVEEDEGIQQWRHEVERQGVRRKVSGAMARARVGRAGGVLPPTSAWRISRHQTRIHAAQCAGKACVYFGFGYALQ